MNILILVNPAKNYKYFFFNTAKSLEKLGYKIYYAYDTKKNTIIMPIPEIDSSPNSFYFDEYLQKTDISSINKENYLYSCTWGEYFYSDFDRFLTHNYNLKNNSQYWNKIRHSLDNFFYEIIEKNKIDLVLYENISNSFEYSAYRIANLLGKNYFGLISSRIPGRYEIQSSIILDQLDELRHAKLSEPSEEEKSWLSNYQNNISKIEPDYMKQNGLNNLSVINKINPSNYLKIIRSIQADIKYGTKYDYASGSLFLRAISSIKVSINRKINALHTKKYFLSHAEIEHMIDKDSFFVYPMHYHPESSTSVLAPEYTNEFNNILNISNNIPFGSYLYVKDHRSAAGLNNKNFYKKISALPAVKLIPADFNIKKLIQFSKGVITVNSTAGYEALILNKPVYLLGNVFYEEFENVYKLANFNSLRSIISSVDSSEILDNSQNIIAYYRITFSGLLDFNKTSYTDNGRFYTDLAKNIHEKLLKKITEK